MALDVPLDNLEALERLRTLEAAKKEIEQILPLAASMYFTAFQTLQTAGFTAEQALQIVCIKGWNLTQ